MPSRSGKRSRSRRGKSRSKSMRNKSRSRSRKTTESTSDILFEKLHKWWSKISQGGLIVVYGHRYAIVESKMKTHHARVNDMKRKWAELGSQSDVKAIIWSAMSTDALHNFSQRVVRKIGSDKVMELIRSGKIKDHLIHNYKLFFTKYKYSTSKDYTF